MENKVIWFLVSGWMVAVLLLASCAPAVVEEEEEEVAPPTEEEEVVVPKEVVVPEKETNMVKWTGTKLDGTVVEKMLEKPVYGGTHVSVSTTGYEQPTVWDDIPTATGITNWAVSPVNETLTANDWARGPIGTGEWTGSCNDIIACYGLDGYILAESWELINTETSDDLVYHIRKGIHWQDKPPLNGRGLTADDVVYTLRRNWTYGYLSRSYKYLIDMKNLENSIFVSPTDKWTVVVKCLPGQAGLVTKGATGPQSHIIAPEMLGKTPNTDWKKAIGTGPFILQDYVGASSLTYVRNPNYWGHDPFFPENQLPYVDTYKILIILDASTRLAGMRTGKIDNIWSVSPNDVGSLIRTNPKLESVSYEGHGGGTMTGISLRNDTKPFDDVKVRRALMMAINYQELTDVYYEGNAEVFTFPVSPIPEFESFYIPLEKTSELVQELYGYHPDKAKQLLTEAGYPDGFKVEVLAYSTEQIDMLSIIKEYWAKIDVDLIIDVRDPTVYTSMRIGYKYTQAIAQGGMGVPLYSMPGIRTGGSQNYSKISDPVVDKLFEECQANYFDKAKLDKLFVATPMGDSPNFVVYASEQAWYIPLPAPHVYNVWQPWLKGYGGVTSIGSNTKNDYAKYVWLDQELKKAMGR